jgi:hypothetical protein
MYEDIKKDFEQGKNIRLDSSLGEKIKEVQNTISSAGIISESPEKVNDPATKELLRRLTQLGIPVDQATTRPGADKIVIFMAWVHSNPGITKEEQDDLGITDSQAKSNSYISKIQKSGLSSTVFVEGISADLSQDKTEKFRTEMIKTGFEFASLPNLEIRGAENWPYLMKWATNGNNFTAIEIRRTVNNIVMAANIGESMQPGEVAMTTMGAMHEFKITGNDHELTYSEAISLEANANVIIINTAKVFYDRFNNHETTDALKSASASVTKKIEAHLKQKG